MKKLVLIALTAISLLGSEINLSKGWNLIGLNSDNAIASSVLNDSNYKVVWTHTDAEWSLHANMTVESNTHNVLTDISKTDGVWVYAENAQTITQTLNTTIETRAVDFKEGWNLVSLPFVMGINVADHFTSDKVESLWKYNGSSWEMFTYTETEDTTTRFTAINANEGFWVKAKSDFSLTFTNPNYVVVEEEVTPEEPIEPETPVEEEGPVNTPEEEVTPEEPTEPEEPVIPDEEDPLLPTEPSVSELRTNIDYTDSDSDGMTDVGELKYGFDPYDANSIPTEPALAVVLTEQEYSVTDVNSGKVMLINNGIIYSWENPAGQNYSLNIKNGDDVLFSGGHGWESVEFDYDALNLNGTEILTVTTLVINSSNGETVETKADFTIDLNDYPIYEPLPVGHVDNKIGYTFEGFTEENEALYRDFLSKVWVMIQHTAGNPAETFNVNIKNMGPDSPYFMIVDDGRTFLSNQEFIPRLIVHELLHAWKGKYLINGDENWSYDPALSGFEEALAEGFAFEIVQEFTRIFPNHPATTKLLENKGYQYHSSHVVQYDAIKNLRQTDAGDYWTVTDSEVYRYSASSTTANIIAKEYPDFYKDTTAKLYEHINADNTWRMNRVDVLDAWAQVAPTVNGVDMHTLINSMPVFNGTTKEDGFYIQSMTRQYGETGDFQFGLTYSVNGKEWWSVSKDNEGDLNLPAGVNYWVGGDTDPWIYPDLQAQPYTYSVVSDNTVVKSGSGTTTSEYDENGKPQSIGWTTLADLQQDTLDLGFYRVDLDFTNFSGQTGASESLYLFGTKDVEIESDETMIMVGVDTAKSNLSMYVDIDGMKAAKVMDKGLGSFVFDSIDRGYEGVITIEVTDGSDRCEYKRNLLVGETLHGKVQFGYVIVDRDFNCVEDAYEN